MHMDDVRGILSLPGFNLLHRAWAQLMVLVAACAAMGYVLSQDLPPLLLLAGVGGLGLVAVAFYRPDYAAALLLVINWGNFHDVLIRYHGVPSLVKPLVALLAVVLISRRFFGRPRKALVADPVLWWMLAYILVTAMGLWYAREPGAVSGHLEEMVKDIIIAGLIFNLLNTQTALERGIWGLLLVGLLLGSLTVYQEATRTYENTYGGLAQVAIKQVTLGEEDRARASGTIGDPNFYGQMLVVLVPLGAWGAIHGRSWRTKLLGLLALLAMLAGIGLSFSRGAYLGAVLVLAAYAIMTRLDARYLLVLPLVGALLSVAPPEFQARFNTLSEIVPGQNDSGQLNDASLQGRTVKMRVALNMLADNILFGVGRGNYREHYREYIRELGGAANDVERDAHSLYLEVASEQGVVGMLVFVGLILTVWSRLRRAHKLFSRRHDPRMASLVVALQVGFLGYLGTSIFLHGAYLFYFWLLVGLSVAVVVIAEHHPDQATQPLAVGGAQAVAAHS